jgi:hypothetical protein
MLANALLTALILLAIAWFIHFLIWKIYIPVAYPYWIIAIFFVTFLIYCFYYLHNANSPFYIQLLWLVACLIPYGLIGSAYLMVYAGIIEYSPSVEILLEVKSHMPSGVPIEQLKVKTLPETMLTGLRIQHLLDGNMIIKNGDLYSTTPKGSGYARFIAFYRKMLFVRFPGEG